MVSVIPSRKTAVPRHHRAKRRIRARSTPRGSSGTIARAPRSHGAGSSTQAHSWPNRRLGRARDGAATGQRQRQRGNAAVGVDGSGAAARRTRDHERGCARDELRKVGIALEIRELYGKRPTHSHSLQAGSKSISIRHETNLRLGDRAEQKKATDRRLQPRPGRRIR